MDAIEALKTRRSIRAYTAEAVARNVIEEMVDCARLAATARNDQPWEFVVVTEREALRRIAGLADYGKFIADAAACVVVLCKDTKYYLEDGSAASQNMLLAATAHGLGACWVAGDKKPYAETIRKLVGAPDGYKVVSLVPFGYPAESPPKRKRPLAEVLHWEKF
ncbi:MAG TPA: nitroreductase family protein [Terracidiphilus sp.]|nr:nitroreductase family protein [Terracidiphilus sp.]